MERNGLEMDHTDIIPDAPVEQLERVVLIGVAFDDLRHDEEETERSLDELALLAESAGAQVVGRATQKRAKPDVATFIGSGKLEEVRDAALETQADTLLFDEELSGAQLRNIEDATGLKILDRTLLILDIFAARAKSREGRLQVELAQQRYRLSRLVGIGKQLSRLGGGIGTRGPGETRLESDRRHIARRIKFLSEQIETLREQRERTREQRRQADVYSIAFVGYTNAGKSSLINALCDACLYTEDRVFATLDPAVRRLPLDAGIQTVAVDTVGFIRKLPHHLVDAFKSTLEEAVLADLIVHVVDAADPDRARQIEIVEGILHDLGAGSRPRVTVFNKADLILPATESPPVTPPAGNGSCDRIEVSARTGSGLDRLRQILRARAELETIHVRLGIPYGESRLVEELHRAGRVEALRYESEWIELEVVLPLSRLVRYAAFRIREREPDAGPVGV